MLKEKNMGWPGYEAIIYNYTERIQIFIYLYIHGLC